MREDRIGYYDPLYDTIVFERGLPSGGFKLQDAEDPLDPRDLVRTAEFSRLAFLRQAGLAWLVFPSATHTRFAHSIGCWWLGKIAETLIKVKTKEVGGNRSLRTWLEATGLREEYYLALLFHDIGHGPFSHVLEHNERFISSLKAAGVEHGDHEHRGALLLQGEGALVDAWHGEAVLRYGESRTLGSYRQQLAANDGGVCIDAVCFLMTSDESYLQACNHGHKESLWVVKALVSGVLDLDRLDHYARDSYFSGLKQVAVNVPGFLSNLRVRLPASGEREPLLSLTHDGASCAASLLFSKRQIISTMFRNPRTVALHAMANWALTRHLESMGSAAPAESLRIAMMEDDQLLETLGGSTCSDCRYLAQRIRVARPYQLISRRANMHIERERHQLRSRLRELEEERAADGSPRFLVHADRGFWDNSRQEARDWLDTGHLLMEDTGEFLTDHPDHASDFSHLREAEKFKHVWVFARDDAAAMDGEAKVKGLFS